MLNVLLTRLQQRHRTVAYPDQPPTLPDRLRGLPVVRCDTPCPSGCNVCVAACPTGAMSRVDGRPPQIDLGRCLFCADCPDHCPEARISFTTDHRLSVRTRQDLVWSPGSELRLAAALEEQSLRLFGRSLKLRQVSAGGCNACEADINVLSTVVFDLGRFGIQVVASPRHADGLIITGPVPENMRVGLLKTYEAVATPKIVIVVGACAISGGPYIGRSETHGGAAGLVPVDLFVPGCPPHPVTILDGMLRLLGRLE